MAEYFGRHYRIEINEGETVFDSRDMEDPLQVEFLVDTSFGNALSKMELSIYNLNRESMGKIKKKSKIRVQAGYKDIFGVIFQGTISNVQTPQESTERRTTAWCWSGVNHSQQKICTPSFAPGASNFEIIDFIATDFMGIKPELVGFDQDYKTKLGKAIGGYSECSPHKTLLNQLGENHGFSWLIENERVVLIRDGAHRQNEPKLINADSGLVGGVSLTFKGVDFEMKLNPNLRIGDRVRLESRSATINFSSIYEVSLRDEITKLGEGSYVIRALKRSGSYYEDNSWNSELVCWREGETGAFV